MEKELEKESRTQQLYDNWSHETNDPETQEWRDDLTAEELEQVERWDEGYLDWVEEMAARILEMEEKKDYYNFRVDTEQPQLPERTFITPEAWPSKIVPENAAELAAAFNKSMNEYICKTDLLPQIAEDEIQKQADRLWESYCKTGEIAGVREQAAEYYDQFEEERNAATPLPIGRIDFLRSNGLVGESVEYTDLKKFEADLKKETHYGAPLCVVLYRDQDGKVPEHKFIFQLDPPPKGLTVTDNPYACEMVQEEPEIEQDYEMEM